LFVGFTDSNVEDLLKPLENRKKGYFGMSMVEFSLGYITVQGQLLCWLISLIQIGSETLMIENLLYVMFSALVLDLSHRLVRNNKKFLFL
jgi:hypothetical protein